MANKAIILADTREQDLHILRDLDKLQVPWERKKLDFGDYSFTWNGKSYENEICIERKGNLSELAINLTAKREQFKNEFERSKGCKMVLLIEDSLDNLDSHSYRSRMKPDTYLKTLKTWSNKYQFFYHFIDKKNATKFIIDTFRNYIIEKQKAENINLLSK